MTTINKTKRYAGPDVAVADAVAGAIPATKPSFFSTLMVLFKARVVSLLLFSAVGGAFMGAGGWPGLGVLGLTLVTGWLAASGASAWNQYIERRSDGTMTRTCHRPLVNGDIANPRWVPWVATGMIVLSVLIALPFSLALAFWLAAGAFIYVVIYTLWLKPRTTLNIVIGGAAGAFPPMIGWAAVTGSVGIESLLLFLIIFMWTPPHFWALAL
ncbi:MAG: UbiA family prenyltransferase, partial [Anaerolineae bacterium]